MSTKARSLRKRLKQKEEQKEPEPAQSGPQEPAGEANKKMPAPIPEKKKRPMLFQAPKRRRDSYIDPLEYFQKEHLIIKEDKMDDFLVDSDKIIPEEEGTKEEKPKPKGGMMMMGMPMPMGGPHGGMPGMGFKINFEEMMKARSKIKKEAAPPEKKNKRPSSVKGRTVNKDEPDNDEEPKRKEGNDEQNLYIKLVMARNKYSELSSAKTNVYDKIMKQIKELREFTDLPPKYMEKVDEFESKLKIPERLILDPDVQEIENENEYEKIVQNPVNLDDIINSLNSVGST